MLTTTPPLKSPTHACVEIAVKVRRPITERLDPRKDVGGNKYNFHEPNYLLGGNVLMCAKGFHSATYCN